MGHLGDLQQLSFDIKHCYLDIYLISCLIEVQNNNNVT